MPAWPGGNCPNCDELMPEKLIHCQNCRTLLNTDLDPDSVEIPEFVPLPEIVVLIESPMRGYFVGCPACDKELRIGRKYVGERVQCKHCAASFALNVNPESGLTLVGYYFDCPHCQHELRVASKYLGRKVACKHCTGKIHLVEGTVTPSH